MRPRVAASAVSILEYLYSEEGQDIAGRHYYRPAVSEAAQEKYRDRFPQLELLTVDEMFGGWAAAHARHFTDGGTFDQIYHPR